MEVVFVHCCVLQFAYYALVMAEDFDAMAMCCETVMICVEPEICDCLFSVYIFYPIITKKFYPMNC
jgi:hypothetical protein